MPKYCNEHMRYHGAYFYIVQESDIYEIFNY